MNYSFIFTIKLLFSRLSVLSGSEQQKAQQLSQLQQQLSHIQDEKAALQSQLESSKQNSAETRKIAEQVFYSSDNQKTVE